MPKPIHLLILMILCNIAMGRPAEASDGEDRVQFGRNIVVSADESAGDLVCIGCSIRVDGSSQDTVAIGGSVVVNGTVKGDLAVVGGSTSLGENAVVNGDVAAIGGHLSRHSDSVIKGKVSSISAGIPIMIGLVLVPLIPILVIVGLIIWLVKPKQRQTPVRAWQPPPTV